MFVVSSSIDRVGGRIYFVSVVSIVSSGVDDQEKIEAEEDNQGRIDAPVQTTGERRQMGGETLALPIVRQRTDLKREDRLQRRSG